MKGLFVGLAWAMMTCVAAAIVMMGVPGEAEDTVHYIDEPWTISTDTVLSDGIWQANDSVTVEGCTLTLDNATLIIGSDYHYYPLTVASNATLVADWSTIQGAPGMYSNTRISGAAHLGNTTVRDISYIEQYSGRLEVVDCTFQDMSSAIQSYSHLRVLRSVFENIRYQCIYWSVSYDVLSATVLIEGCEFIDETAGTQYGVCIDGQYRANANCKGIVRQCRFVDLYQAIYIEDFLSSSMEVAGNTAIGCSYGLVVNDISQAFSIHDNVWRVNSNGMGLDMYSENYMMTELTVWNETVTGGNYGIFIENIYSDIVFQHVNVTGSRYGVYAGYVGVVELRDSSVHGTLYDFYVYYSGQVRLFNVTHDHKGYVYGHSYETYVEESCTMGVEAVVWQSGTRILSGWTYIVNETGTVLASFKNDEPCSVEVPLWRVDFQGATFASSIRGAFCDRGARFYSLPMPIGDPGPLRITIIDDVMPWVKVTSPRSGDKYKEAYFKVDGLCDDLGSGLIRVRLRFGDEAWRSVMYNGTGAWSVTVAGMPDRVADVVVRVQDEAGNINETVLADITVDTAAPTITVVGPTAPVNSSPATLVLMTEPHATAFVGQVEVPVAENGAIVASIALREGVNPIPVTVVDSVGRTVSSMVEVTLDTMPPALRVDSPVDGSWCAADRVVVVGLVTEDVTITIDGEALPVAKGTFSRFVLLDEELTLVLVTAMDAAGNVASETRLVHHDSDRPQLTITSPANGAFVTTQMAILRGTVTDAAPVTVSVSGNVADVTGDQWKCAVPLMEGNNLLEVQATDAAGNDMVTAIYLVLDTTPPSAVAMLIVNGQRVDPTLGRVDSRASEMELEVSLVEACSIDMNVEGPSSLPAGLSKVTLTLQEGLNDIRLDLQDMARNRGGTIAFQVLVDTTRPVLELERSGQIMTRDPEFLVRGSTEAGCLVLVGGAPVDLLSDCTFTAVVHLKRGSNAIRVESIDAAGNKAERNLMVDLEEVKVGGSIWGGTSGGVAVGVAIGLLLGLGALGVWMRRRPAAPQAALEPAPAPSEAAPPASPEGEQGMDGPWVGEGAQYPRAGVVRRKGR